MQLTTSALHLGKTSVRFRGILVWRLSDPHLDVILFLKLSLQLSHQPRQRDPVRLNPLIDALDTIREPLQLDRAFVQERFERGWVAG